MATNRLISFVPRFTGDETIDQNLRALKKCFDALLSLDVVTNLVVKTVAIASTPGTTVYHGLGRPVRYWTVIGAAAGSAGPVAEGTLPAGVVSSLAIQLLDNGAGGTYRIRFE